MRNDLNLLAISLMIVIATSFCGCFENSDDWGEKGELVLEISLDPDIINQNQSTSLTFTIMNNGTTNLRVLLPWWFVPPNLLIVKDDNGSVMNCLVDYEPPPTPKNEDLTVLKPGEEKSIEFDISSNLYDFKKNNTYILQGKYSIKEKKSITKPYWKGTIYSDEIYLKVI